MKVSVLGAGYVGLVSGTCFAEMGHTVTCIDTDHRKVELLKSGHIPIYEPGLKDLLERNHGAGRLFFSTEFSSIRDSQVIFLAVGTPANKSGEANLDFLFSALNSLAQELQDNAIVVIKSTVPVGTSQKVKSFLKDKTSRKFCLVNNPEFLKEGSAIDDFMRPDRVVIGFEDPEAAKVMEELYAPLVRQGNPILKMSNLSAEMTKYAANSFLATKISFINEMARICDRVGADIEEVRRGITSDKRIGPHFLYPGPGYGGSCFPKDVLALIHTAQELQVEATLITAVDQVNNKQKVLLLQKIKHHFRGSIKGKTFALWGVAFKPNTDDIRESSAIDLSLAIIKEGGNIHYYDPVAADNFKKFMQTEHGMEDSQGQLKKFSNKYECLEGTDGLIVLTDWAEFKVPEFPQIKDKLREKVIFDGRNLYNTEEVLKNGLSYYAIGKFIPGKGGGK